MKSLFKRRKKEKNDADLYQPPTVHIPDPPSNKTTNTRSTLPPIQHQHTPSEAGSQHLSDHSAGYRFALNAYAETISPAISNEDGLGGGGGTLRSRSGQLRGSAGKKHRSLIPVFETLTPSSVDGGGCGFGTDRYSFDHGNDNYLEALVDGQEKEHWAPIPEEPHSPGQMSRDLFTDDDRNVGQEQIIGQSSSETAGYDGNGNHHDRRQVSPSISTPELNPQTRNQSILDSQMSPGDEHASTAPYRSPLDSINFQNPNSQTQQYLNPRSLQSSMSSRRFQNEDFKQKSYITSDTTFDYHSALHAKVTKSTTELNLQPDAIYEEHYGDAYVDQLINYLYPSGYQSMRPRSGPWRLSILISILFMWLSVFIVGHCYDQGQKTYDADDAYLQDMDDDTLVMETRWCGSKLVYFMWFVCVSITILAVSYCSIIGYIKMRDVAVANGRSQPPGMMNNTGGRSDCYVAVENVRNKDGMDWGENGREGRDCLSTSSTGYSSYQGGTASRYPSIYQSDGTPQFWGGHIYRPMQAAVAMTNR